MYIDIAQRQESVDEKSSPSINAEMPSSNPDHLMESTLPTPGWTCVRGAMQYFVSCSMQTVINKGKTLSINDMKSDQDSSRLWVV